MFLYGSRRSIQRNDGKWSNSRKTLLTRELILPNAKSCISKFNSPARTVLLLCNEEAFQGRIAKVNDYAPRGAETLTGHRVCSSSGLGHALFGRNVGSNPTHAYNYIKAHLQMYRLNGRVPSRVQGQDLLHRRYLSVL